MSLVFCLLKKVIGELSLYLLFGTFTTFMSWLIVSGAMFMGLFVDADLPFSALVDFGVTISA